MAEPIGNQQGSAAVSALEQQAEDLAAHLRLALDAAGLGTWRWDLRTDEVIWDERQEALFGFAPGTFDGSFAAYAAALHPEDREASLATVDAAIASGEPYRVEHRVLWPDGTVRWIAGAGRATFDAAGAVTGAIGCSMDITERMARQIDRDAVAAAALAAVEQERIHRERLELLSGVNDALARADDRRQIMAGVVRAVVPHLADWCSIHVLPHPGADVPEVETYHLDPEMVVYAQALSERHPYDPGAPTGVPNIIRTGRPEFYPRIDDRLLADVGLDDEARDLVHGLALRSAVGVPLIKRGRVVGALLLVMTHSRREYTEDDLALAEVVAGRVASSLENRRLSEQQHRIATTLQQSLLPDRLPSIPGMEAAVRYWAAGEGTEVGGDFYDLFPVSDSRWSAVVGDVCGTGPTAAALTGLARHNIRQSAWRGDDPATVLRWLNRAMLESTQDGFLTAAYLGVSRCEQGFALDVAAAGHPLPILVGADGAARFVGEPGTLVGAFEAITVNPVSVLLEPGDTLVLYTDGVTDVAPPHDLDDRSVLRLVERSVAASVDAEGTADNIHAALGEILPLDRREDDIALLVLRAEPTG